MGTGSQSWWDTDLNSLYANLIKVPDHWVLEFSWKRRTSNTSGDAIWLEYAYRKVGTNEWLNKVDYLVYRLMQE